MRMQGCQPELRVEVWPYLLRLHSPSANQEQRRMLRAELSRGYANLLRRCQASTPNSSSQARRLICPHVMRKPPERDAHDDCIHTCTFQHVRNESPVAECPHTHCCSSEGGTSVGHGAGSGGLAGAHGLRASALHSRWPAGDAVRACMRRPDTVLSACGLVCRSWSEHLKARWCARALGWQWLRARAQRSRWRRRWSSLRRRSASLCWTPCAQTSRILVRGRLRVPAAARLP